VFLENVAGPRNRGLDVVLADLVALRYDTTPTEEPGSSFFIWTLRAPYGAFHGC